VNSPVDQRLSLRFLAGCVVLLLSQNPLHGAAEAEGPVLLFGGAFEKPPIHRYLQDSKKTVVFPAYISAEGGVTPLDERSRMGPSDWDVLLREERRSAALQTATLDPSLIRDRQGVVQAAVISTESPVTASCILSPGFLRQFSSVFGPEVILAIPARNKIYVFPKLANRIPEMTVNIRDDYLISPMPVSTELFELSKKGLRAVADIDPG